MVQEAYKMLFVFLFSPLADYELQEAIFVYSVKSKRSLTMLSQCRIRNSTVQVPKHQQIIQDQMNLKTGAIYHMA